MISSDGLPGKPTPNAAAGGGSGGSIQVYTSLFRGHGEIRSHGGNCHAYSTSKYEVPFEKQMYCFSNVCV